MMERPESRSSGLPRISKLPQGRPLQLVQPALPVANTGIVRPPRRNTVETQPPILRSPPPASTPASKRQSMLTRPGFTSGLKGPEPLGITSPISTGLQRPQSSIGRPIFSDDAPKPSRGSRPSLSERTADSLAQVPPSPAGRRQSAFYGAESPIKARPPSRAESAMGYRPGSRIGSVSGPRAPERPVSPSKRPGESGLARPGSLAQSRRIPGTKMVPPKTTGIKSPTKTSTRETFGGPLPSPTKAAKPSARTTLQEPRTHARTASQEPKAHLRTASEESDEKPVAKSSSGLRDAIAHAKATYKSSTVTANVSVPRATSEIISFGPETDPATINLLDSAHINITKKRIHNALTNDGKLNIASLCLTEIPTEVLQMHDIDLAIPWYDRVEVTHLLAADNELKEIPPNLFPTASLQEEPEHSGPFPTLRHLDLHGNQLVSLPETIVNLGNLESLNLGRNLLTEGSWGVIMAITSQKRLEIGKNKLSGSIPTTIGELKNLELLDVHDNAITDIPSSVGNLTALRDLKLSHNNLKIIPFEALFDLPLGNINAGWNKLSGSLFPKTVPMFEALVDLDVSHNGLAFLAEAGVKLPKLRRLNVSHNRVMELPDMTTWQSLEELNAEENKISAFPEGFSKLKALSAANFSNNSLLSVDRDIGFMDKLLKLDISYNPIRERMLMKLNTDELKAELRSIQAETKEKEVFSPRSFGSTPATPTPWTVSSNTVDRSNTRLISIDADTISGIADQNIRSLILHHNSLQVFPMTIELLGPSLTTLDLANNKLGKSVYLGAAICLPNLASLNLTSNALTTLTPLTTHLSADRLATLILPFNRLTELPGLTAAFPSLKKLMVSNNKITQLDVDSVRGLEVLDISSNELEALPPQLGLLQGQLRTLMANANKFRVPGWGVLEKGTDEILKWCKSKLPHDEVTLGAEKPDA